jgi:hypothetical protein
MKSYILLGQISCRGFIDDRFTLDSGPMLASKSCTVEDSSGRGQNVADADHDQRENARMLQSEILIFFLDEDN